MRFFVVIVVAIAATFARMTFYANDDFKCKVAGQKVFEIRLHSYTHKNYIKYFYFNLMLFIWSGNYHD